jgi:hypothetical protein
MDLPFRILRSQFVVALALCVSGGVGGHFFRQHIHERELVATQQFLRANDHSEAATNRDLALVETRLDTMETRLLDQIKQIKSSSSARPTQPQGARKKNAAVPR